MGGIRYLWLAAFCVVGCNKGPDHIEVRLIGHAAGDEVQPGERISVEVLATGDDEPVSVLLDVVRKTDGGGQIVDESQSLMLRAEPGDRTLVKGTLEWEVQGDYLKQKSRSELIFRVHFEDVVIETPAVIVDVDPQLIDLVVTSTRASYDNGDVVTLKVRGSDVGGQPLGLEMRKRDAQSEPPLANFYASFDADGVAEASYPIEREALGALDVVFIARFGDQATAAVGARLQISWLFDDTLELFRIESGGQRTAVAGGTELELRQTGDLIAVAKGTNLAGRRVTFSVSGDDHVVVASGDTVEYRHTPSGADFSSGQGVVQLSFRAEIGAFETRSAGTSIRRWRLERCVWFVNGNEALDETMVRSGATVELHGIGWGLEQAHVSADIFEQDTVSDDHIAMFAGNELHFSWGSHFVDDCVTTCDSTAVDEYYFTLTAEDESCRSPLLLVGQ